MQNTFCVLLSQSSREIESSSNLLHPVQHQIKLLSLSWVKSNVLDELPSYLAAKDRFLSISNSTYLPTYILLTLLKSIEKVISTLSKNIKRGIGNKSSKKPELKTKKKYFPFLPLPKNSSIYLFDISKILVILYGLVTREIGIS